MNCNQIQIVRIEMMVTVTFEFDRLVRKTRCILNRYWGPCIIYKVDTKHYFLLSIIAKVLAAICRSASLLVMTLKFCARDPSSNPTRFVNVIILQ